MISTKIAEAEKIVYVDVSGYISSKEANEFINSHKQSTINIKNSQYKLVVTPSIFECEKNSDIRNVCMSFLKSGYKKMYLVDPKNNIMDNLSLGYIEKKLFMKSVTIISNMNDIK
ncbi:MAG: hypothetical protein RR942_18530 [Romboutsia sp.]